MSDFDVVRRWLMTEYQVGGLASEALAALDRIEKEHGDWQVWYTERESLVNDLTAENERLREASWAGAHCSPTCVCRDEAQAENERLRSAAAEAFDFLMRLPIETAQVWRVGALADRLRSALQESEEP